jgi:hypothetical protein
MSSPYAWHDDRFASSQLADFNSTPGEHNGRYMTAQEKDQVLTTAGIPLTPEHH